MQSDGFPSSFFFLNVIILPLFRTQSCRTSSLVFPNTLFLLLKHTDRRSAKAIWGGRRHRAWWPTPLICDHRSASNSPDWLEWHLYCSVKSRQELMHQPVVFLLGLFKRWRLCVIPSKTSKMSYIVQILWLQFKRKGDVHLSHWLKTGGSYWLCQVLDMNLNYSEHKMWKSLEVSSPEDPGSSSCNTNILLKVQPWPQQWLIELCSLFWRVMWLCPDGGRKLFVSILKNLINAGANVSVYIHHCREK